MAKENKYGVMALSMRVIGRTIWPMEKADSSTRGAMYIKETGLMIKRREKEFICIKMVHLILVSGSTTNSTVSARKNGLMALNIKEILLMGLKKDMELLFGLTAVDMTDNLRRITLKDSGIMYGLMVVNTKEFGKTIKCTEKVFLHGLMEENTKVSM